MAETSITKGEAEQLRQQLALEVLRARGLRMLKNQMYGEIDPTEGDFYRGAMYNTQRAADTSPRPRSPDKDKD